MAGVNYTSEFLGFHNEGFKEEDLTASTPRSVIDNIPLPAHDGGVASYASLSFDSEIGYGEKVADYIEENKKHTSVTFCDDDVTKESPDALSYVYDDGTSTPIVSPVKVPDSVTDTSTSFSSTFIAFDTEKVQETAVPESDFTFMDVHSPEPARKFIERSLHDLDDFISDRRLQLSEMKRINAKKISGEVPEHANPLYYSNYKKLQTPPIISSSEKPQSQFSSPSITIPRKTYDGIRDGERTALQQLKAEQEKLKRLEFTITDLEQQCSSFTEKIRSTTEERNRMANTKAQADADSIDQNNEIIILKEQLQKKNHLINELENEIAAMEACEKKREAESTTNGGSKYDPLEGRDGEEKMGRSDPEIVMAPEDVEKLLLKCSQLEQEVVLLMKRYEEASSTATEWAQVANDLEEQRKVLVTANTTANEVATLWQTESAHFEQELERNQESLLSAEEDTNELEKRVSSSDAIIAEKEERISELMLALTDAKDREKEIRKEREEIEKDMLAQMSKNSHIGGSKHLESPVPQRDGLSAEAEVQVLPPPSDVPPTEVLPVPPTEEQMYGSFWSEDHLFDGMAATPNAHRSNEVPSSALSKQSISASLAKRVLITWNRTPVRGDSKDRRCLIDRGDRTISQTNFLLTTAFFQVTVWFLLLLASYLYFADFKSCKTDKFRYTH